MDTLDKGKHCSEEYCHQLDYLPMQCKACIKYYCSEHFKYEAHSCEQAKKLSYKIPVCQLCNNTIEFKRGKDLELSMNEHMQKCQSTSLEIKPKKKNCNFKNCKSKDIFCFECEFCNLIYCNKHRIHEDHFSQYAFPKSCSQQFKHSQNNENKNSFSTLN
jgi:hypothetical protein